LEAHLDSVEVVNKTSKKIGEFNYSFRLGFGMKSESWRGLANDMSSKNCSGTVVSARARVANRKVIAPGQRIRSGPY
jgi:hypothetical protein